jgi:hypothetical protein
VRKLELKLMEDYRVRSNEEKVINIDGNIAGTTLKDGVISVNGFEAFRDEEVGEGFILYAWRLFEAIQGFIELTNASRIVT